MLAAIFLILLVVVGLVVMALLLPLSPPVLTYYYAYPSPQVVQTGTFGVDSIVTSSRVVNMYSDEALTKPAGVINTYGTYTQYPTDNLMTYNVKSIISVNNGDRFMIESWMEYTANPPAKPSVYDFTTSFVSSSNKTNYIGRKYNSTAITPSLYKLEIGL